MGAGRDEKAFQKALLGIFNLEYLNEK